MGRDTRRERDLAASLCTRKKATVRITDTNDGNPRGTFVYVYGRTHMRLVARRTLRAFIFFVPFRRSRLATATEKKEAVTHSLVEVVDDGGACSIAAFLDGA